MTTREYIKRRFRNLALIFLFAYANLRVLSIFIRRSPETFTAKPWLVELGLTAPTTLLVILAWFAFKVVTIKCPRCARPLGDAALAALIGNQNINRCLNCRVSLDEPAKASDPS
jgi:hypothetical protein